MKISIQREALLKPLQQVIGAVERRQTLPALGNVLIRAADGGFSLTATDLEIELVADVEHAVEQAGEITVPARKLADICKALPDGAELMLATDGDKVTIRSGRSRFSLTTLPAAEFPTLEEISASKEFTIAQGKLKGLIERTSFAMANQDVRYYLNGLMLEVGPGQVRAVATDGHRLALCDTEAPVDTESSQQVIVPRKGIQELVRLLEDAESDAKVQVGANHIRVTLPELRFTSKLIDGRFPDYERVLPKGGDKLMTVDRELFRQALSRASILSNEKYRGIRLMLDNGVLKIQAHNPEQEEAEEEIEVAYEGEAMEIGFNVNYLLDVLNTVDGETITATLKDSNSSALLSEPENSTAVYVVMPMRL